jgi:hypothetical protein
MPVHPSGKFYRGCRSLLYEDDCDFAEIGADNGSEVMNSPGIGFETEPSGGALGRTGSQRNAGRTSRLINSRRSIRGLYAPSSSMNPDGLQESRSLILLCKLAPEVRPACEGWCPLEPLPRAARVGLPPHRLRMSPAQLAGRGRRGVLWRPPSGGSPTRRRIGIRPLGNPWPRFAPVTGG